MSNEDFKWGMRYLTRYSQNGLEGWLVKFNFPGPDGKRKYTSKLFRYNKWGSESEALVAAKEYRKKWLT